MTAETRFQRALNLRSAVPRSVSELIVAYHGYGRAAENIDKFLEMSSTQPKVVNGVAMSVSDVAVPVLGTRGADVLMVDASTSFTWVPDAGTSYSGSANVYDWDNGGFDSSTSSGPSTASGHVTIDLPSSMPFTAAQASGSFNFSQYGGADIGSLQDSGTNTWSWNPQTGVLDPSGTGGAWGNTTVVSFEAGSAAFHAFSTLAQYSATDLGHWEMDANSIDVNVFGGAGNDTIYGGQGTELLSGGAGDDTIFVGRGQDTVLGGSGNDTIWGGIGTQILRGGSGDDVIHAGTGDMTLLGGTGNDTLYGGQGTAHLSGGSGDDWLYAGSGNETLEGGSGRDVFAFVNGVSGTDVITDFRIGTDVMQVTAGMNGLAVSTVSDLASHISAGTGHSAVVTLGAASVTLLGLSSRQVETHLEQVFRIA